MSLPPAPPAYGPPPRGYDAPLPRPPVPAERPPTPWWAVLLSVLGVLVVALTLAAVVSSLVYQAATRTSVVAVDESGVRELRITGVTGGAGVTTTESTDGRVSGTASLTTSWNEADVTLERDGDVLTLAAECGPQGWPRRCDVDYELVVDPGTDVVVDMVTGGLQADGLAGDVDVDLTTGGVMLTSSTSSRVDVSVITGGVVVDFVEPPTSVDVTTVTGGIGIGLPEDGETYAVSTDVSVGGSDVTVPTDPTSPRTVTAATTVGGIDIHLGPWDTADRPGPRGGPGAP